VVLVMACNIGCGDNEPPPAVQGHLDVQDGRLFYEVRGEGPPVVLIHGGATHLGMWDDQFDLFARHYRVVRYDVRGFGKSGSGEVPHSQWDDLLALLQHLEIERTHIVGLSLGGRIAVDFALQHPQMVDRLVLAGPGLSGWQFEREEWVGELARAIESGDKRAASEAWLQSPYLEAANEIPGLAERLRQLVLESEQSWIPIFRGRRLTPPAVERLSELKAQTLVILGSRDVNDIHRIVKLIAEKCPGARKVVLEGAGHMVNMEQPEDFNGIVLEFLQN
jgi:pimeloyl-ACP methyl ester carboxylesterase